MLHWKSGVSRIALLVCISGGIGSGKAWAADIVIDNTTATTQQTVNAGDTLTVTGTGTVAAGADPAVSVNGGASPLTITNSGTIETTISDGSAPRAIRLVGGSTQNVTITNNAGATIQAPGDAINAKGNISSGTVSIVNAGTIASVGIGSNNGQAIDFNKITSNTATVTITNMATGVISAADADAIRAANGGVINNYGKIISNFDVGVDGNGANSSNDGIDFQSTSAGTVNNFAGGLISGARHGITGDLGQTVNNYGTIIGNDGSGINIDTTNVNDVTRVTNYGTIVGTAKSADGDGIDVDQALNLENYGTVKAVGIAPGADLNEGLAIGGGTINNYAGALIYSDQRAITVNNSDLTPQNYAPAAVHINNYGTIWGANGDAIGITSIQNNSLTNAGTILGNVWMGSGDDTVTVMAGSRIVGLVDGGLNTGAGDTLVYQKIGLTAAKEAALQAGQTVNIGGTLYTGFENFTGSTVRSFSSYATDDQTAAVAGILDNGSTTQSASATTQGLIDQVASASDVNGALAQLSPTDFQGLTTAGINNAFQTTQTIDQRLSNLRDGGLAFDTSGLGTAMALLNRDDSRSMGQAVSAYASASPIANDPAFAALDKARAADAMPTKAPRATIGDTPWGMFLYGNAIFAHQGATANSPESKFNTVGVTGGIDRRITPDLLLGVFGGYSRTNADLDTNGSTSKIDTWLVGGYGSYTWRNWFVNGAVVYGRNAYNNSRVALGTVNSSSPKGDQFALQGTVGVDLAYGSWIVTPELGAQYTTVRVDAFSETGPAALNVQEDRANSLRSSLGGRLRRDWSTAWGVMTPELRASWQHEFLDRQRDVTASFVDQGLPGTFTTTAAGAGTDFGVVGTGLTLNVADRTSLQVGYDFKFGGHDFTAHQISGRLRHVF